MTEREFTGWVLRGMSASSGDDLYIDIDDNYVRDVNKAFVFATEDAASEAQAEYDYPLAAQGVYRQPTFTNGRQA